MNKIEHRLFSPISMNWPGRPLGSHQVIVNTIAATTTRTGLTVHAELDTRNRPNGIKLTDRQMEGLERRAFAGVLAAAHHPDGGGGVASG